jgi:hypothetical protein
MERAHDQSTGAIGRVWTEHSERVAVSGRDEGVDRGIRRGLCWMGHLVKT